VSTMGYGHDDDITRQLQSVDKGAALPWYMRPDARRALAARDIPAVYQMLYQGGVSQREIARRTGQSQSEVSEIIHGGRQVRDATVLERIADGLGVPRPFLRLLTHAPGEDGAYSEGVTVAEPFEGVSAEMLRRHLLALGGVTAFGGIVTGLGEFNDGLPIPAMPTELPARIGMTDVAVIRDYTGHLRILARTYGGQGAPAVALAQWADQWLTVDASDATRQGLRAALADLHAVVAWCCHDSGAVARSHHHFARSVQLAIDAGDSYRAAYALRHAGMMLVERSEPNDALKLTQLGGLRLSEAPRDNPGVPVLRAELSAVSAFALSRLDDVTDSTRRQARAQLAKARDKWAPPDAHARGDMDLTTGLTCLHLGQLNTAEAALMTSVQTFQQGTDRREGVVADIALAQVYVQAGEPRGLIMAKHAIDTVTQTRSGTARELWLEPLATALEARPGADAKELARMTRQVAATRV
jgi:transcriptional regulator with XRE-family HTH domain